MSNIRYRSDIDGLRAVAVLSVILCHANAAWLPGGFVGVDIFFVISGFLITSIIHREMNADNFSFRSFYLRRIKRILPVFFVVLLMVLLTGSVLLSASDMQALGKSSRYATFFASNFYFSGNMDYFAPDLKEMPLLHTWSLAVEEQFYFVWPLMLMFLLRYCKKGLFIASFLLCIASFVFASICAHNSATAIWNYYQLPSRMGELLLGSMLAIYRPTVKYAEMSSILGLTFLLGSFLLLNEHSIFPGYNALWPCLGAVLLIYAGSGIYTPLGNRLLTWRPVVFVGLLSYSLYLWHWPILAFARYIAADTDLSIPTITFCLALSLVLSWLTWRWVEQPIRQQNLPFKAVMIRYFIVPALLVLVAALAIKKTDGYLWQGEHKKRDKISTEKLGCLNRVEHSCTIGAAVKPQTIIYGDSHAQHFSVVLDRLGKKQHWSADFFTVYGCPFLAENNGDLDNPADCQRLTKQVHKVVSEYNNVIIAMRWYTYLKIGDHTHEVKGERFAQQFASEISSLASTGKQIFLVAQIPEYTRDPFRAFKRNPFNTYQPGSLHVEYVDYPSANHWLYTLAAQYSNVHIIDFNSLILHWQDGIVDGLPMYMDHNHLNQYGQEQLFREIENNSDYQWLSNTLKTLPLAKPLPMIPSSSQ